MLKGIGNLASMLKQAQEIGSRMQGVAADLRARRATGSAGGGLVEIEVNGLSEVLRCRIDPSLVEQNDRELIEDLVAAAVNQALEKAKQLHAEALKSLTGNLDLPGLEEAMGRLTEES
jgi:DNA-binding YbaB/EbfC family protein